MLQALVNDVAYLSLILLIFLCLLIGALLGQRSIERPIKEMLRHGNRYVDQLVTITGKIDLTVEETPILPDILGTVHQRTLPKLWWYRVIPNQTEGEPEDGVLVCQIGGPLRDAQYPQTFTGRWVLNTRYQDGRQDIAASTGKGYMLMVFTNTKPAH
jgi:hypothetical protein